MEKGIGLLAKSILLSLLGAAIGAIIDVNNGGTFFSVLFATIGFFGPSIDTLDKIYKELKKRTSVEKLDNEV